MRFQLSRHGKPDLLFSGAMLATVCDTPSSSQNWWEFSVYKTSVDAYILAATFHVVQEGDRTLSSVLAFATPERLLEFFQSAEAPASSMAAALLQQLAAHDMAMRHALAATQKRRKHVATKSSSAAKAPSKMVFAEGIA